VVPDLDWIPPTLMAMASQTVAAPGWKVVVEDAALQKCDRDLKWGNLLLLGGLRLRRWFWMTKF
jgi:hypothetical protein